jgi:hypothetical protein
MKILFSILSATALAVTIAQAQTETKTSTSTSTTDTASSTSATETVGTITEFTPGSAIVLNTGSGAPVNYKLGKNVTFVNAKGKVIEARKITKDRKVRVHYVKDGNDMMVDKVTIVRD